MVVDIVIRSFHSTCYDLEWLETRFKLFCKRKLEIDHDCVIKRLENAPQLDRNIVYRELGRSNPAASLFFIHGEKARSSYLECFEQNTSSSSSSSSGNIHDDLAKVTLQDGQLADAIEMVEALRNNEDECYYHLYVEVLKLFEISHIIHFCHEEYLHVTELKWVVDYIHRLGLEMETKNTSYSDSFANGGIQLKTMLEKIASVVDSLSPTLNREERQGGGGGGKKIHTPKKQLTKTFRSYMRNKKRKMQLH
jgi:hypothetical protein